MSEIEKGSKVRIINFCGDTQEAADPNFKLVGQEGYVHEVLNMGWITVKIPTHRYHSKGNGALLNLGEVELFS
jgi:hypothetical protein